MLHDIRNQKANTVRFKFAALISILTIIDPLETSLQRAHDLNFKQTCFRKKEQEYEMRCHNHCKSFYPKKKLLKTQNFTPFH